MDMEVVTKSIIFGWVGWSLGELLQAMVFVIIDSKGKTFGDAAKTIFNLAIYSGVIWLLVYINRHVPEVAEFVGWY